MKGDKSMFLEIFGESPVLKIIDYFLDNRLLDYSKKDVIEGTGIARGTFFKYWKNFEKFGIVKVSRSFGKTKLYKLNEANPTVKLLMATDWSIIKKTFDDMKVPVKVSS